MTKQHIVDEIKRTAKANGGKPLGWKRFEGETGIRYHDWFGKHWKSWGDAVRDAGLRANAMRGPIAEVELLDRYASLARELGRVPVKGDLLLKHRSDPTFPSEKVFARFGTKADLQAKVRAHCLASEPFADIAHLFMAAAVDESEGPDAGIRTEAIGFVYLLKAGRHYKIGRTNSVGRRARELEIQLPEKARTVHVIKTDDPEGIEAYWHGRFASKRGNGEWFALTSDDVAAFKRRRFQ